MAAHQKKKMIKLGKMGKKFAKKVVADAGAASGDPPAEEMKAAWRGGELVGKRCKIICEKVPAAFGKPAVVDQQDGTTLLLKVEDIFHSVQVEEMQIELLPALRAKLPPLRLQINGHEKNELRVRWPMLDSLSMNERLTGDHIMVGDWVNDRDMLWDRKGAVLVPPHVIVSFYGACIADDGLDDPMNNYAEVAAKAREWGRPASDNEFGLVR